MNTEEVVSIQDHEEHMRRCIVLAKVALSRNNTPVGSLVVRNGDIIGEGIEALPGGDTVTGHAEIIACQAAIDATGQKLLEGATLYTTAEPCFMCSYVIRQCRIALVVYGVATPDIGGITSSHPILIDNGLSAWCSAPRALGGILLDECQQLSLSK